MVAMQTRHVASRDLLRRGLEDRQEHEPLHSYIYRCIDPETA
jgi:hypothetical protein